MSHIGFNTYKDSNIISSIPSNDNKEYWSLLDKKKLNIRKN